MRRREKNGPTGGTCKFPNKIIEPSGPLGQLISIAEKQSEISLERFFGLVNEFAREKVRQRTDLEQMENFIRGTYSRFSLAQREKFFTMLYNAFAETYDEHMIATGHYEAIKNVLFYAGPHLRTPILDITAGTGEVIRYVMDFMATADMMRESEVMQRKFGSLLFALPEVSNGKIYANEISSKMLEKAREKLRGNGVTFTDYSAYALPDEYPCFRTVICSQTFHLIPDEDKVMMVRAIRNALAHGGIAVVMEEDPFRISPTPHIEPISLFIRSVAAPIKHRAKLSGLFTTNGFERLEERAVYPIDSEHVMRLHLFRKI
ncbi:class I SAM-dependent methyltransferase [Candidatus Micrarchaeota archaeon]|nr:class I SAM-dependent methyltransferase [Candidatus Micrarchaeota archaeon]